MFSGPHGGSSSRNVIPALTAGAVRTVFRPLRPTGLQLRVIRAAADSVGAVRNPRGARVEPVRIGSMTGTWVSATGNGSRTLTGAVLYLHGGGFVLGSSRSHFGLVKRLSAASGMPVLVPDYRLAPEAGFPVALDDALAAYRCLIAEGYSPDRIRLAGDSAGGYLVAALLAELRRQQLPVPAGALLMSPLLDLDIARAERTRDPVIPLAFGNECISAFLGETAASDPRVDVLAADKRGWPPVLIQVGSTECLLPEAKAMADSLTAAGVPCELQIWPGQVHVFQVMARVLPVARIALTQGGAFLRTTVGTAQSSIVERDARPGRNIA
ncbi:acetyl esterase/lipase [Nocardia fluminea]|uniref:Acetyl esterase/lipase n=2 Tax=Nocardia fluminea TaxID=134984 RepID=A0A2N3VK86_9NOCA|nr:acetyl esterase/lipase [Nocardia fluminea]